MRSFTAEHTPAEIVKIFPYASDLFKENHIDFCCGGDKILRDQFKEHQVAGDTILFELNTRYEKWLENGHHAKDWDSVSISNLVDYIVDHHHGYLKKELPALSKFVTRVFHAHGSNQPHLRELHRLYDEFSQEMAEHTIKEEEEVFPLIKEYAVKPSEELLERIRIANGGLEAEHEFAGDLLKKIRQVTSGFEPPVTACGTYRVTYARLAEMESNTFEHIHLENNILFKRL